MFTKFLTPINSSRASHSEIFSPLRKTSNLFSFKRKQFTHRGFHPMEITVIDNRESSGRSQTCLKSQTFDVLITRTFLQFHGNFQRKNIDYQGKKLVGYSADQMFDVVADIEKYEKFLPFCKKSDIIFKSSSNIKADLMIGFPPLVESYTSDVSLVKPQLIKAVCTKGRLFNYLITIWKFSPGLKNNKNTSIIDFYVSFEFRSALHSHFANFFFNEVVTQMENAFYQEAQRRYGKPVVQMQTLNVLHKNS